MKFARKIKVAREAIGHIRATQERVIDTRERPPVEAPPVEEEVVWEPLFERLPVQEPVKPAKEVKRERPPREFAVLAFLYVVLAISILILVLATLVITGTL